MKTIIFSIAVLGFLASCAIDGRMSTSDIVLPDCEEPTIPPNCDNSAGSGPANPVVNFNKNSLNLAPPNVCANAGTTIEFKITPASGVLNPPGSVAIVAKNADDTWLVGTNAPDASTIKIELVPLAVAGAKYEYTILSNKNGVLECVDPRIHVK